MDDFFRYLLVIGIILFGIVKQVRKEAKPNAMPSGDSQPPLPGNWDGGLGEPVPSTPPAGKQKAAPARPFRKQAAATACGRQAERTADMARPTIDTDAGRPDSGCLEEVRKGIIWSEILNRKY